MFCYAYVIHCYCYTYIRFIIARRVIMASINRIIFKHGEDDFELWEGFSLSAEEKRQITEILSRHETGGCSVRGSKTDILEEIQYLNSNMYKKTVRFL